MAFEAQNQSINQPSDEIDLLELFANLWRKRWIIAATMLTFLIAAILYLNLATYTYSAELTVSPVQGSSGGATSKLGGLSQLASLAGVNMPQDQSAMAYMQYSEGLKSEDVAAALARRTDLMKVIFNREWNEKRGQWQEPRGVGRGIIDAIKRLLGIPVYDWQPPDRARLQQYIEKSIKVEEDAAKPFTTLSYDHPDPVFAKEFLTAVNNELDGEVRRRALIRSTSNINYLASQLGRVTLAEHRLALAQSLGEQERIKMMASSSTPYAADPIGSVSVSAFPTSPRPALVLAGAIIAGLIFGCLLALGKVRIDDYRASRQAVTE